MITYSKKGSRHIWGMNNKEFIAKSEVFWILMHTPGQCGFNRREWTVEQREYIEKEFNTISYPPDYATMLHNITGQ